MTVAAVAGEHDGVVLVHHDGAADEEAAEAHQFTGGALDRDHRADGLAAPGDLRLEVGEAGVVPHLGLEQDAAAGGVRRHALLQPAHAGPVGLGGEAGPRDDLVAGRPRAGGGKALVEVGQGAQVEDADPVHLLEGVAALEERGDLGVGRIRAAVPGRRDHRAGRRGVGVAPQVGATLGHGDGLGVVEQGLDRGLGLAGVEAGFGRDDDFGDVGRLQLGGNSCTVPTSRPSRCPTKAWRRSLAGGSRDDSRSPGLRTATPGPNRAALARSMCSWNSRNRSPRGPGSPGASGTASSVTTVLTGAPPAGRPRTPAARPPRGRAAPASWSRARP